jgi:protein involved in sex pheromone biosynthesis
MRTLFAAVLLLSVCLIGCGSHGAQNMQTTTTTSQNVATITKASQTANNTSSASSFQSQRNGNLGANNVSKVDVHSLLYPGTTTKVFAQLLFGLGNRITSMWDTTPLIPIRYSAR